MRPKWARGEKFPPWPGGPGGDFTTLETLLLVTALGIVKYSRFWMSFCYIPVGLFLKFVATLFSALHLVLCWSFWHCWYKLQYQILLHFTIIVFSVSIRLRNGDQFAKGSQTLKNCCKTGESRESVNSAKMPQNGPGGGDFTALVYCSRNSKE